MPRTPQNRRYWRSVQNRRYWRSVWERALRNMPTKPYRCRCISCKKFPNTMGHPNGMLGLHGAQSALARCLGYYSHVGVYNGYSNGSKPKGERLEKLLKCAGPYGELLAQMHLKKRPKLGFEKPRWGKFWYRESFWNERPEWEGFGFYENKLYTRTLHLGMVNSQTTVVEINGRRYLRFGFNPEG